MSTHGQRSATRRTLSPTAVIAVLLPLLTVGALALVQPDPQPVTEESAEQVRPERVDLACPTPLDDDGALAVAATGGDLEGSATVTSPGQGEPDPLELQADAVTRLARPGVAFLRGTGDVASELIGSRFAQRGLAATECVLPQSEYWFPGVGAGANHASVLELSNPDEGPAVADITVLGPNGPLDAPTLRGVTVPGGETTRLELAQEVPRRGELSLQVDVSRGRLAATVEDEIPAFGSVPATRDWLPAVPEPATELLLLGLVAGDGNDTLVLSNPGVDEARVELQLVTEDAAFVPEGVEEIRVAAQSTEKVDLTEVIRRQVGDGALALRVLSTSPVTAALGSVVDGDLVHAPVVTGSGAATTALVPPGEARVVLARAAGAGVATVEAYDDGRRLLSKRVELTEGSGGVVELPRATSLVRVTPQRTQVSAAVVARDRGATVVPLRELVRRALVPAVRPGLP